MTRPLHLETLAVHQGFRGDETNSIDHWYACNIRR